MKKFFITAVTGSLILSILFCVPFSKGKACPKKSAYCSKEVCKPVTNKQKDATELDSYIPMVTIWGYD